MVQLVTCNGKSACKGRLIDGGKTMLFLGMINGGNTMLLLLVAGGLIDSRDTALLLLAGRRFGCLRAKGESACTGRLINGGNTMFFLGMINGGNITLLLACTDVLIDGGDMALLFSAG
jgi:hypothetical protein